MPKTYTVEIRGGTIPLKEWMAQNPRIAEEMAEAFWQGLLAWRNEQ